jgi:hypothetical protein
MEAWIRVAEGYTFATRHRGGRMNAMILNRVLLVVGIIGLPICICYARRAQSIPLLVGIGLFGYLVVSSIVIEIRQAIHK